MSNKFVDYAITDADMVIIENDLKDISDKLTFLVTLSAGEKRRKLKMGDKTLAFINDARINAVNNPTLYPPDMNFNDFKKDWELLMKLQKNSKNFCCAE